MFSFCNKEFMNNRNTINKSFILIFNLLAAAYIKELTQFDENTDFSIKLKVQSKIGNVCRTKRCRTTCLSVIGKDNFTLCVHYTCIIHFLSYQKIDSLISDGIYMSIFIRLQKHDFK